MAGGGTDAAVGIDGHDVQIRQGEYLLEGAELVIHNVQQLAGNGHHIFQIEVLAKLLAVYPAVCRSALVRHSHEVHIVHAQAAGEGPLAEPEDILEAQVRLHGFLEHLGDLADIQHVFRLHHLLDDRLQEVLLQFHTARITDAALVIAVGTVMVILPPADDLHGVVAAQVPQARCLLDDQILRRVVVVHGIGHVEIHAADGVHDLAHGLPLQNHLIIRLKANQLGDFFIKSLDALLPAAVHVVNGVDLLHVPVDIYHGVPGNGHDVGLLVGHIVARQQHGVRVAAAPGVPAQDQHGVVILALPFAADAGLDAVAVVDAVPRLGAVCVGAVSLSGQFRLDEQAVQCHHGYQHHRQYDGHRQQPLLSLCQSAGLLCFLLFGFLLF